MNEQLTFHKTDAQTWRVRLNRKAVGKIIESKKGFRYVTDSGSAGDFFKTFSECSASLSTPVEQAKTYRCALFSPSKGQCTLRMYHTEAEHSFDESSPWSQTLEELQAWYAKRDAAQRLSNSDDVEEEQSFDDEFSGDRDLAIGERDDQVNMRDDKRSKGGR